MKIFRNSFLKNGILEFRSQALIFMAATQMPIRFVIKKYDFYKNRYYEFSGKNKKGVLTVCLVRNPGIPFFSDFLALLLKRYEPWTLFTHKITEKLNFFRADF